MDRSIKIALAAGVGALVGAGAVWFMRKNEAVADDNQEFPDRVTSGGQLVSTVGKHWVLTNQLLDAAGAWKGRAANYGWPFKGPKFDGKTWEPSVSNPNQRVIQGIGTAHNEKHADYSQTVVLVSQSCLFKGEGRRFSELITDPAIAPLLSAEGALRITRQPGVPEVPPNATTSDLRVSRDDVLALPSPIGALSPAAYADALAKREAIILSWVQQGMGEYDYVPLEIDTGDGMLIVSVFTDALKFGGVRINASAYLEQQIADALDCSLLTPKLADIVYASATQVLQPIPLGASANMASTAMMVKESDAISASLAKALGS